MLDFSQKRKIRKVLYHKATLVILGLLVLLSIRSVFLVYQKQQESHALTVDAERRVVEIQVREGEVHAQIGRLQTAAGVEAEIRSKFSVAKANENMVVIVDNTASTTTHISSESWFQRIIHFFTR